MSLIKTILSVAVVLAFTCLQGQDEDRVFMVKAPAKDIPKGEVVNLISCQLVNGVQIEPRITHRLVMLDDKILFQERDKQFAKGEETRESQASFLPSITRNVSFKNENGLYQIIVNDSTKGDKKYPVFSLELYKKYLKPFDWLSTLTRREAIQYDYSICTDTLASVSVANQLIPCYKIESFQKAKKSDIKGHFKVTTYIDKKHLLLVKEIHEFKSTRVSKKIINFSYPKVKFAPPRSGTTMSNNSNRQKQNRQVGQKISNTPVKMVTELAALDWFAPFFQ